LGAIWASEASAFRGWLLPVGAGLVFGRCMLRPP